MDISDRDRSLTDSGIRSGDTIQFVFQLRPEQDSHSPEEERVEGKVKRQKTDSSSGLKRKVVPADNSCLFTAINYCMSSNLVSSEHSAFMRCQNNFINIFLSAMH